MKRLLVALVALLTLEVGVAQAVPGPEPGQPDFEISVNEILPDGDDLYSKTSFAVADGWDFGDRSAYSCAWVEFFQAGAELFEVHYEMVAGYPIPIEINDRNGIELPDPEIAALCGDGSGAGPNIVHDGSDHFPHGTSLNFYLNDVQIATIDYSLKEPGDCDRGYWTPGDEAGEAWLWWDEDGPRNNGHHDLDCGGGPGEPVAVVRAYVQHMAAGVGVCTEDSMDGDQCVGISVPAPIPSPVEHSSDVTLSLRGRLRASGHVSIPDGTAECAADRTIVVERRASGVWKKAGDDLTTADGLYSVRVRARDGKYRAQVLESTLANGDTCKAATSERRVYLG